MQEFKDLHTSRARSEARLTAPSRTTRTLLRASETVRLSLQVDCDFKEHSEPLVL